MISTLFDRKTPQPHQSHSSSLEAALDFGELMKSLVKQQTSTTEAKSAGEALTRKHAGINVLYDQEEDKTTVKNFFGITGKCYEACQE